MCDLIIVAGARPQFIKAAPLCKAFDAKGLAFRILHTGQHFDSGMSDVFFKELNLPHPVWNLGYGGGTHGEMTGGMLEGIEKILMEEKPSVTLVLGDTNSTLAGALAAAKLHIPVAHVEAGLRSGNRRMPEELNRICADHLSDMLFCSSITGLEQLAAEGIRRGVHVTGDVMADVFYQTRAALRTEDHKAPLPGPFALLTLHRAENTDDPVRLKAILDALALSGEAILFPLHPRTRIRLEQFAFVLPANIHAVAPAGYETMVSWLEHCRVVLTDSGGLQKEALWAARPCITLRDQTEWSETVECGWNTVTGVNAGAILSALAKEPPSSPPPQPYGDGRASLNIADIIAAGLK
jgi:UDP-GlcNAc3NAcA epimerase